MSIESWCYPTIASSAAPFSFCLQPFPASGSSPMSWLFASRGQSIRASASVFPMDNQGWFPLELTGLISLPYKGLWIVFSSTTIRKHEFFGIQPSSWSNSHISMTTGKTMCVPSCFSHVWLFTILWTIAHQAPLSRGFSKEEYRSGLPCPPPADLTDPGIEPRYLGSPALAGRFFTTSATWKAMALTIQTFVGKVCFFNTLSFNFVAAVTVWIDSGAQEN